MTMIDYIRPMSSTHRILFLVYDGFDLLDLSGPASVFTAASTLSKTPIYDVQVLSSTGGEIRSNVGPTIMTRKFQDITPSDTDTVLIVGADEPALRVAVTNSDMKDFLKTVAVTARRYGSICVGAFILANAGLLNGRRAATHWAGCARLAKLFPDVSVNLDALYVVDGPLWTSAGASTGIDMALAMVEQDLGPALMGDVAKWLVIYAHRPGNQSQFSTMLNAQTAAGGIFSDAIYWMDNNLDQPIRLDDIAERAGMSERTFRRKFTQQMGITPSKFLEHLRLVKSKGFLEAQLPVGEVALAVGYRSEARFRSVFKSSFGLSPSMYRIIHGGENDKK